MVWRRRGPRELARGLGRARRAGGALFGSAARGRAVYRRRGPGGLAAGARQGTKGPRAKCAREARPRQGATHDEPGSRAVELQQRGPCGRGAARGGGGRERARARPGARRPSGRCLPVGTPGAGPGSCKRCAECERDAVCHARGRAPPRWMCCEQLRRSGGRCRQAAGRETVPRGGQASGRRSQPRRARRAGVQAYRAGAAAAAGQVQGGAGQRVKHRGGLARGAEGCRGGVWCMGPEAFKKHEGL